MLQLVVVHFYNNNNIETCTTTTNSYKRILVKALTAVQCGILIWNWSYTHTHTQTHKFHTTRICVIIITTHLSLNTKPAALRWRKRKLTGWQVCNSWVFVFNSVNCHISVIQRNCAVHLPLPGICRSLLLALFTVNPFICCRKMKIFKWRI